MLKLRFFSFFLFFSSFLQVYSLDLNNQERIGVNFIIPAAGDGKRLQSNTPKALHYIGSKTSLQRIVDSCYNLFKDFNKTVTVIASEKMLNEYSDLLPVHANYIVQKQKFGTAHAVKQTFDLINKNFPISIVIWGDSPLIKKEDTLKIIELIKSNKCDYVSTSVLNVKREVRGGKLSFVDKKLNLNNIKIGDIVEINDITEKADLKEGEEPAILINAGMTAFNTNSLLKYIHKIDNNNQEKEYYLPHFIKLSKKYKIKACTLVIDEKGSLGFNTKQELNELSKYFAE